MSRTLLDTYMLDTYIKSPAYRQTFKLHECTTLLFKVLYGKIKNVFFIICLFTMHYLCENYYQPVLLQSFIADCIVDSWGLRLTFWPYKQTGLTKAFSEWNSLKCRRHTVMTHEA